MQIPGHAGMMTVVIVMFPLPVIVSFTFAFVAVFWVRIFSVPVITPMVHIIADIP